MGIYLNSAIASILYRDETVRPYFVDKTYILQELFPLIEEGSSCICITRPRRFGKTVMANMLASFLSKEGNMADVFDSLYISGNNDYRKHLNQYNVIHISLNEMPKNCSTYQEYIDRVETKLLRDLTEVYPDAGIDDQEAVWDALKAINAMDVRNRFVFILDEWDYIFHRDFITNDDKKKYVDFLSNLLKGKSYVQFAYMTGILPIAKYSSGSELNMFTEFTMAKSPAFSHYFGFTEEEVDMLFQRYCTLCKVPAVTREGLKLWYDGYHAASGERMYNPRSVVQALRFNHLESYWTSSGPYDEIFYYIENNIADVQEDLALMVSGLSVPAKVQEYAATSMNLSTKDEIFSAMVVYGFLSYKDGYVSIPNKELMEMIQRMLVVSTFPPA